MCVRRSQLHKALRIPTVKEEINRHEARLDLYVDDEMKPS